MTIPTTRRTVVRGLAWTTPVIAIASAAPAFATSADPITGLTEALKCPGKSTGYNDSVVAVFDTRSIDDAIALAAVPLEDWSVTVNGIIWDVKRVTRIGSTLYIVTVPRDNSANGVGTLRVTYTLGTQTFTGVFAFSGTHPDHDICGRV